MGVEALSPEVLALIIKILVVTLIAVHVAPVMLWVERRVPANFQRRVGPNRVGLPGFRLFGLMQPLADAVKLVFKEEVVPAGANKFFFHFSPILFMVPAMAVFAVIPFGLPIQLGDVTIPLSVINVDVGFLFIFAVSSLGVYGVTMAGWASNNKYGLMGAIRAGAQMISYEIPLGLSLLPIVLIYGTLNITEIVQQQTQVWGVFLAPVSFVLFFICMFAETNRAPFDLSEGESELIAGFFTEYGTMKFAGFFFAEYLNMFTLSCLVSLVFFGGWNIPFVSHDMLVSMAGPIGAALIGMVVLLLKAAFFMFVYVWVRWTLPRFRYDQLMNLGWKFMMPVGLVNTVVTAAVIFFLRQPS